MATKRIVFIMDGMFTAVRPEKESEDFVDFDVDIADIYTTEQLEDACIALGLDFEGICGHSAFEVTSMTYFKSVEQRVKVIKVIKESI